MSPYAEIHHHHSWHNLPGSSTVFCASWVTKVTGQADVANTNVLLSLCKYITVSGQCLPKWVCIFIKKKKRAVTPHNSISHLVCTPSRTKPSQAFILAVLLCKDCNGWVLIPKDRIDRAICLIHALWGHVTKLRCSCSHPSKTDNTFHEGTKVQRFPYRTDFTAREKSFFPFSPWWNKQT